MITWTMVAVLCFFDGQCRQFEVGEFQTKESCIEAVDTALVELERSYVMTWIERVGTMPPPAQAGAGCRKDRSV